MGIAEEGWCFSKIEGPLRFLRNYLRYCLCCPCFKHEAIHSWLFYVTVVVEEMTVGVRGIMVVKTVRVGW